MMTKFSIVCTYRMIQSGRDVRAGSDMGSDQVAQGFIQLCLENLPRMETATSLGNVLCCRSVLRVISYPPLL